MNLELLPYSAYERGLPQEGNFILGQQRNGNIFVYQAFNDAIADYAVANQKFGGPAYSFSRMTWIKPNFLWMMYRSGWAQKENQERILAIEMTYNGFLWLLKFGVTTSYQPKYGSHDEWKKRLDESDVRIQWDPDHGLGGEKLKRRAVQIGIKDEALKRFHDSIESITDITPFVIEQYNAIRNGKSVSVISESIIEVPDGIRKKFYIPKQFHAPEIDDIIRDFETNGVITIELLSRFLSDGDLRVQLINYFRNNTHKSFSRALLKTATDFRKYEDYSIMGDDLLLFAWFVSKNHEVEDLKLVVDAKLADFDTWCGFDGDMVYTVLDYETTQEYLRNNAAVHPEADLKHLIGFQREHVEDYRKYGQLWFL